MKKVSLGQTVTITCQGLTVTGVVTYVDHEWKYSPNAEPEIIGYYIEIRSIKTGKPHYWKSLHDGGTITIHEQQKGH